MLRFEVLSKMNSGKTSTVCLCTDRMTGKAVAIKFVRDHAEAHGEIQMLQRLGHPNIIDVRDCFEDDQFVAIVLPLMSVDLSEFVHSIRYTSSALQGIQLQVMRGLHHIHVRGVLHMDIKPENIGIILKRGCGLVDDVRGFRCVLLDFGSARLVDKIKRGDVIRTTAEYVSPEMLRGVITSAGDIFSMGRVFRYLEEHGMSGDGSLVRDMLCECHAKRPSATDVLRRLGEPVRPDCGLSFFWNSMVANLCDGDASVLVDDTSHHLHKIVSLLRCGDTRAVDNAFWLLQEEARREFSAHCAWSSHPENDFVSRLSVVSIFPYFHSMMGFSRMACYFYARALDYLSALPYFVLSDDMRVHICRISVFSICQSAVIRTLSRCCSSELLVWCALQRWGANREVFVDFVHRFVEMGEAGMCMDAATHLTAVVAV